MSQQGAVDQCVCVLETFSSFLWLHPVLRLLNVECGMCSTGITAQADTQVEMHSANSCQVDYLVVAGGNDG